MAGETDGARGDRLEQLYEEVLALAPEARGPFLDRACSDDPELRAELDSLLTEGVGAETFMEDVGRLVAPEESGPPDRLVRALTDRYSIEEEVGRGGMAVVYRARDLRHERKVALKVLRPELAAIVGGERFLAEIKTTANLQHPNILALFDSGEAGGHLFYVMPYVEGESLRARLDREQQLPVDEAVRIATSMADALDYAHRQGVIHRDIKPDNVLLVEGKPVIADFGIALAVTVGGGDRLTETGLSLGTPHYMSPEQATGDKHIGPATDIYALGCVLYEMLTGEPPFTGRTPQAVLGRIITGEAEPVSKRRRTVPTHVEAALQKALEKVPADRFGSGAELGLALRSPDFAVAVRWSKAARPADRTVTVAGYAVTAVAAALLTWWVTAPSEGPAEPVSHVTVTLPDEAPLESGSHFRLFDDGSGMVYGGRGQGLWSLRWSSLEPPSATPIPGSDGVGSFDPSPEGDFVAMRVGDSIRVQSLETPASRLVMSGGLGGCCVRWQEDGWIYFTNAEGGLGRVSAEGGAVETLTVNDGPHVQHSRPIPVDGGRFLVFEKTGIYGIGSQIALLDTDSGEIVDLVEGAHPSVAGGLLFFTNEQTTELRVARLEGTSLGTPTAIVGDLWRRTLPGERVSYDLSPSGNLLYIAGTGLEAERSVPVWVTRSGQEQPVSPRLAGPFSGQVRLSPDERSIAVGVIRVPQTISVWHLPDGPEVPVTPDGPVNYRFSWTPSGDGLYFSSTRLRPNTAVTEVFRASADGVGDPELVGPRTPSATLSPDSAWWVFRTGNLGTGRGDLMVQSTAPGSEPRALVATSAAESQAVVSPDGRWVAYSSDITGVRQVFVAPFPNASTRFPVSLSNGHSPAWSPSTNELFYVGEDDGMWVVRYDSDPAFQLREGTRTRVFDAAPYDIHNPSTPHNYDVTDDGERFVMMRRPEGAGSAVSQLSLVVNAADAVRTLQGR